jgi:putative SOS response-associated peptidase YedK
MFAAVCGRFSNTRKKSDELHVKLAEMLGVPQPESGRGFERFNIAPTQEVVSVVDDEEGRRMQALRWGLIPSWSKDAKPKFQMINARAETVLEKRSYRGLIQKAAHRCLIVADGWYEWQKPEDPKQPRRPLHFALDNGRPFFFAGLWTTWASPEGEEIASCTIVTCEANAVARPIHDRMPVVLPDAAAGDAWLAPQLDGVAVREFLRPLAADLLRVQAASPVVNSARHEGPDCLLAELPLVA